MTNCPNTSEKVLYCQDGKSSSCPCKNRYKDCADTAAKAWGSVPFPQTPADDKGWGAGKYMGKYGDKKRFYSPEAHHILSTDGICSEIGAVLELAPVLEVTKYCINASQNMIALPRFAFVLSWYVNLETGEIPVQQVRFSTGSPLQQRIGPATMKWKTTMPPPPFAGLAQHCTDHVPYIELLKIKCKEVANVAKDTIKEHPGDDAQKNLADDIEALIPEFKARLTGKNTHDGWNAGLNNDENWYLEFSMVGKDEGAEELPFPIWSDSENRLGDRIKSLQKLFGAGVG